MGYGSRSLEILNQYYSRKFVSLEESIRRADAQTFLEASKVNEGTELQSEQLDVRDPTRMPPLLQRLSERTPENLNYLGVSFGITSDLFRFWKHAGYVPLYLRQTENPLTGEYTCIMLKALGESEHTWLSAFAEDFRRRLLFLLSFNFRKLTAVTALTIVQSTRSIITPGTTRASTLRTVRELFSPFDLKRLDAYCSNMLDYHNILDLLPSLASLYFGDRFEGVQLSAVQETVLVAIGLQHKALEDLESELSISASQTLALFVKVIKKITKAIRETYASEGVPEHARESEGQEMYEYGLMCPC